MASGEPSVVLCVFAHRNRAKRLQAIRTSENRETLVRRNAASPAPPAWQRPARGTSRSGRAPTGAVRPVRTGAADRRLKQWPRHQKGQAACRPSDSSIGWECQAALRGIGKQHTQGASHQLSTVPLAPRPQEWPCLVASKDSPPRTSCSRVHADSVIGDQDDDASVLDKTWEGYIVQCGLSAASC